MKERESMIKKKGKRKLISKEQEIGMQENIQNDGWSLGWCRYVQCEQE